MNAKEIVSEIMEKRGFTNSALAKKLGFSTASGVSERLRGKQDMRVDTLVKFLEAMDCEVIVKSKLGDKMTWTIDVSKED
jgi:transcriptional regulator with XRE-family HTH domain